MRLYSILSHRLEKQSTLARLAIVFPLWCGVFSIYRFLYLGNIGMGEQINPLFAIPILASGWLFGVWGGVISTSLAALIIVLTAITANRFTAVELSYQVPGILIGLISGLSSGWISNLWHQLQEQKIRLTEEIAIRQSAETALQQFNNDLEELVASRTTELTQANQQLETSLLERETMLKEIHHRVKNNLQVISSLLSLQAQRCPDEQTRKAFQESQTRVRSMALIHEKLYRSGNFARINIGEYVGSLAAYLVQTYQANAGKVLLNFKCETIFLDIDTAVPVGLILNELISNALKHAFPKNTSGEISIALFTSEDKLWHLIVSDNGAGLPAGLDVTNTSSLGLELVNNLVEQIDGRLQITNNKGLRYEIAFSDPA